MARFAEIRCHHCDVSAGHLGDDIYECPQCFEVFTSRICSGCGDEVNSQISGYCSACGGSICSGCNTCPGGCRSLTAEDDLLGECFDVDGAREFLAEIDPDSDEAATLAARDVGRQMAMALQDSADEQQSILEESPDCADNYFVDDERE